MLKWFSRKNWFQMIMFFQLLALWSLAGHLTVLLIYRHCSATVHMFITLCNIRNKLYHSSRRSWELYFIHAAGTERTSPDSTIHFRCFRQSDTGKINYWMSKVCAGLLSEIFSFIYILLDKADWVIFVTVSASLNKAD